jgi:hypothetical protein
MAKRHISRCRTLSPVPTIWGIVVMYNAKIGPRSQRRVQLQSPPWPLERVMRPNRATIRGFRIRGLNMSIPKIAPHHLGRSAPRQVSGRFEYCKVRGTRMLDWKTSTSIFSDTFDVECKVVSLVVRGNGIGVIDPWCLLGDDEAG